MCHGLSPPRIPVIADLGHKLAELGDLDCQTLPKLGGLGPQGRGLQP